MRISSAFPTKYISAPDLQGREATVTIDRVTMEEVDRGEHKPIVYFQGKDRGLVLNKTNATNISMMYGDETDTWTGRQVTLFTAWVDFQGRSVEAIRVKPPQQNGGGHQAPAQQPAQQQPAPAQQQPQGGTNLDDEIPF